MNKRKYNSAVYRSLSIAKKGDVLELDYNEVADILIDDIRKHKQTLDGGIYHLLEPERDLIAFLLSDEFSPEVTYNLLNSELGKGILLGMLLESIQVYYDQLEASNEDDNRDQN